MNKTFIDLTFEAENRRRGKKLKRDMRRMRLLYKQNVTDAFRFFRIPIKDRIALFIGDCLIGFTYGIFGAIILSFIIGVAQ